MFRPVNPTMRLCLCVQSALATFTLITQVSIVDTPAATVACSGFAQFALITVASAETIGMSVPAKHQQQRNDDSHHTRPCFARKQLARIFPG
jgi:hypothetical protein